MDTKLTQKLVTKGKRWCCQSLRDATCGGVKDRAVGTIVVLGEHPGGHVAATSRSQDWGLCSCWRHDLVKHIPLSS